MARRLLTTALLTTAAALLLLALTACNPPTPHPAGSAPTATTPGPPRG